MESNILVSVIIPVYNSEKYLRECLDSVINQTLREIEIICVDDGSTDGSLSILREYEKKNPCIKTITQPNSGVSAARNMGLRNANGVYIAFLDSDDYVDPDTYHRAYQEAVSKKADIVVFGGDTFPELRWADMAMETRNICYHGDSVKALFHETGSIPFPVNKLYRRELFRKNDLWFDETLRLGEDQALMFDLFPVADTVAYIRENFYHYRQHDVSAMAVYNANIDAKIEAHMRLIRHIVRNWEQKGYTKAHGSELASWIIKFLFRDLDQCRYNFKITSYREIINTINGLTELSFLDGYYRRQYCEAKRRIELPYHPRVSVIMPIYNAEEYLAETLYGLSAQKYWDFEIIFVDDGSTDHSLEIVEKFARDDRRARVLKQQHRFAGVARNYGMEYAKGEYLLFLDSDDFFSPDMILKAVQKADQTNSDICVFQADRYDQVTKKKTAMPWTCNPQMCPTHLKVFSRSTNARNIFCFTTPAPWNKLFRKSFVTENGLLFQDTRSANDMAFVMTALAVANRIAIEDSVLLTYRVNNQKSLQGSQNKKTDAFYMALLELKKRLTERNIYREIEPAFINFALDCCLYNLGTMSTPESFQETFDLLKYRAFEELDLLRWPKECFYAYKNNRIAEKREDILNISYVGYAQKYGFFSASHDPENNSDTEQNHQHFRIIDWIFRKVRGGIQCYRDNGLRYTIRRVGQKTKGKILKWTKR